MSDQNPALLFDRCADRRLVPGYAAGLWPSARVLAVSTDPGVSTRDGELWFADADGELDDQRHYLLGRLGGRAVFVEEAASGTTALRTVMDGLSATEREVAFAAVGLAGWHSSSRFCPRCGAATEAFAAGQLRRCCACGEELYPRTDPAVIVAITDAGDRLLLGRQPSWPARRQSVFAGFVEIGESLERAVYREMDEELGVRLTGLRYFGSQPWPFPRSLMIGFSASAEPGELRLQADEIESAHWFTRDELAAAVGTGEVLLPGESSIAHRMITAWLDSRLTQDVQR